MTTTFDPEFSFDLSGDPSDSLGQHKEVHDYVKEGSKPVGLFTLSIRVPDFRRNRFLSMKLLRAGKR
jgi:hypothetical protein